MKFLQVMQDSYLPQICGNSMVAYNYHKMLNMYGYQDSIFLWNKDYRDEYEEYEGVSIYNPKGDRDYVNSRLKEIIERENIDIVINHSYQNRFNGVFRDIENIVNILVAHTWYESMCEIQNKFDFIIVFQERYIEKYIDQGVEREKLIYLPVPRDINLFKPRDVEKYSRSLLYVGRIIEGKNIYKIIPYLEYLNADLTLVGPTEETDNNFDNISYIKKIKNLAEKENVIDRIKFKGVMRGGELAKEYNKHSVFVLLSTSDCYSLVLQEAIMSGIPAVVYDHRQVYNWTRGRVFIENTVEMVMHRVKLILDGLCELKYDKDFVDLLSRKEVGRRFLKKIGKIVNKNNLNFVWKNKFN